MLLTVPEMVPVLESMARPPGKPVALKLKAAPFASMATKGKSTWAPS